MMLLSLTTGQAQQSQELCSAQMCISATIYSADTKTIEFSLFSMIPVGWLGLGIGGDPIGMAGNDLAVSFLVLYVMPACILCYRILITCIIVVLHTVASF
jgi:hypothetical protein